MVLGIDTSSRSESVAVTRDGVILQESRNFNKYKPSTEVFPLIQRVLAGTKISLSDIHAIAVSIGPGSFTGLRVGLSMAKGLALSLAKPIIPVSSLEAMVRASGVIKGFAAPLMDARRGEIYGSLYEVDGEDIKQCCDEYAVEVSGFCRLVSQKTIFFGDGASFFSEKIRNILGERAEFFKGDPACTVAGGVALLGQKKFEGGWYEDINMLTPKYIRQSDAELGRLKKGC